LGLTGGTVGGDIQISGGFSATTISGDTLNSGSTNLYSIFSQTDTITRVQPGSNITTGGTANAPTVNLTASPSVNNITFSGTAIGGTVQADSGNFSSLSATSMSATTYYGDGGNLSGLVGSFGITVDGAGSVITEGVKGYLVIPYNATIMSWDIIGNTTGDCVVDIWKSTVIPISGDTIAGSELPTLNNQQINSNNTINTWNRNLTTSDKIAFNVISASTVSRINLIIKVIKI